MIYSCARHIGVHIRHTIFILHRQSIEFLNETRILDWTKPFRVPFRVPWPIMRMERIHHNAIRTMKLDVSRRGRDLQLWGQLPSRLNSIFCKIPGPPSAPLTYTATLISIFTTKPKPLSKMRSPAYDDSGEIITEYLTGFRLGRLGIIAQTSEKYTKLK